MPGDPGMPWDVDLLRAAPAVRSVEDGPPGAVRTVFYDGLPWKGKPTRVFAHCGVPRLTPGERCPGMVLVHGGGGSAHAHWVKMWLERGYAAISMDTCGCTYGGGHRQHQPHEHGGPPGWGDFENVDAPPQEQWSYHAVADVLLAHSLLRSFPEVDPDRIGVTGVSWGGYLTCIAAGLDPRFRFAAPVYGCGFLGENSAWLPQFRSLGEARAARWLELWDPSRYLPRARMPMLWVTGTNDFAYPMDSLQKSYRLPRGDRTLCVRVNMPHGHTHGEKPAEIHAFAEAIFRGGTPLARVRWAGRDGRSVWVEYESCSHVEKVEMNYTADGGKWQERKWTTVEAAMDPAGGRASAVLPENVRVHYFNVVDRRGLVASSEHEVG
jgi:dienelactone hydrolase